MQSKRMLEAIKAEFLDAEGWKKTSPLGRKTVRNWMNSRDIEILGAVNRLLFDKEHWPRVVPPLSDYEISCFRQKYYGRCLLESSQGETDWQWADQGFDLTHGVVYWIRDWLRDESIEPELKVEPLHWLARMLNDPMCGKGLKTAVYDHLIEERKVRRYFAHWRDDPKLSWMFEPEKREM